MQNVEYRSLRITRETREKLSGMQLAFEAVHMRRMTKDEFVQRLMDCVSVADPAVWDAYRTIAARKEGE